MAWFVVLLSVVKLAVVLVKPRVWMEKADSRAIFRHAFRVHVLDDGRIHSLCQGRIAIV